MPTFEGIYPTDSAPSSGEAAMTVTIRAAHVGLRAVVVEALHAAVPSLRVVSDDEVGAASAPSLFADSSTVAPTFGVHIEEDHPVWASLRRTRRLLRAGEAASGIRHALNNPLTAILAEAQLLQLEDLPEEHAASVCRIVEQARRMVNITRTLEGAA
jgi:signal transduction histidine kinase